MKIIAHRGDSANHPENTPASWGAAFAAGAHAIEADIRFSADGIGICAHDPTLNRLFGRSDRVDALTLADLSALKNENDGVVGLFADVLHHAAAGKPVLLDLKDESALGLERLWQAVERHVPLQQRHFVIAGCHTLESVKFFAARGQVTILGFIMDKDTGTDFFNAGASIVRLWESDVSPERVAQLKALGAEIWVTTGAGSTGRLTGDTDAASIKVLAEAGIAGVLINDVSFTKTILETVS